MDDPKLFQSIVKRFINTPPPEITEGTETYSFLDGGYHFFISSHYDPGGRVYILGVSVQGEERSLREYNSQLDADKSGALKQVYLDTRRRVKEHRSQPRPRKRVLLRRLEASLTSSE